jgi:hypothetical protein
MLVDEDGLLIKPIDALQMGTGRVVESPGSSTEGFVEDNSWSRRPNFRFCCRRPNSSNNKCKFLKEMLVCVVYQLAMDLHLSSPVVA